MTAVRSAPARSADTARGSMLRPAPRREPPFDDELPARRLSLIGPGPEPELPFAAVPVSTTPPRRRLTLVPDAHIAKASLTPPPPPSHPDPARFGRRFAQGVIEVLSGRRPPGQMTRHVSPAVQRGLIRAGTHQPLRAATAPVLHSLHLTEPADGVCELSAVVIVGPRYRAVAARLEWKHDRWICTALQVG